MSTLTKIGFAIAGALTGYLAMHIVASVLLAKGVL